MKVLIIVVTYNAIKWVSKCLGTIYKNDTPTSNEYDVFLVDNGSLDGTIEYVKQHFPQTIITINSTNLGFGKANNLGLKYMLANKYDYAYLLNQDAWITPESISRLIDIQQEAPEYYILSPKQMQANMQHLDTNFLKNTCVSCYQYIDDLSGNRIEKVYDVHSVMAAHWLLSRKCIEDIGLFSPSFPHYGEDSNYTDRVHFHGKKVGIVPSVLAIHDREKRKDNIEKKLYLSCYISFLYQFSKPNRNSLLTLWRKVINTNISYMFVYHSFTPIKYIYRLIKESEQISKNRKLSMKKGAFINIL